MYCFGSHLHNVLLLSLNDGAAFNTWESEAERLTLAEDLPELSIISEPAWLQSESLSHNMLFYGLVCNYYIKSVSQTLNIVTWVTLVINLDCQNKIY